MHHLGPPHIQMELLEASGGAPEPSKLLNIEKVQLMLLVVAYHQGWATPSWDQQTSQRESL